MRAGRWQGRNFGLNFVGMIWNLGGNGLPVAPILSLSIHLKYLDVKGESTQKCSDEAFRPEGRASSISVRLASTRITPAHSVG